MNPRIAYPFFVWGYFLEIAPHLAQFFQMINFRTAIEDQEKIAFQNTFSYKAKVISFFPYEKSKVPNL